MTKKKMYSMSEQTLHQPSRLTMLYRDANEENIQKKYFIVQIFANRTLFRFILLQNWCVNKLLVLKLLVYETGLKLIKINFSLNFFCLTWISFKREIHLCHFRYIWLIMTRRKKISIFFRSINSLPNYTQPQKKS